MKRTLGAILVLLFTVGLYAQAQPPPTISPELKALIDQIKALNDAAQRLLQPAVPSPCADPKANNVGKPLPCTFDPPVVPATMVRIAVGADLQAAINAATPGQTLLLASGATFTGNFKLPKKTETGTIIIRTDGLDDAALPPGLRVSPAAATRMAKLAVKDPLNPTLSTDDGAHDWTLIGLEVLGNEANPDRDSTVFGTLTMASLDQIPINITLDRMYIHGGSKGGHRGVQMNGKNIKVVNSHISGYWEQGRDSQAIGSANGPGPYTIENNYLEGSGENFMMGGSDPKIPGLVPSDITFRNNYVFKPLEWKTKYPGSVKNLFELKNARRVIIEYNVFENNWIDAQAGHAIVFTPRNQNGTCPQCVVEDVTFQHNVVKNVAGFFINLSGFDDINPVAKGSGRIKIINNLFLYGPRGYQMQNGADSITVSHNTMPHLKHSFLSMGGLKYGKIANLDFNNNVQAGGSYGVVGDGTTAGGTPALDWMAAPYKFTGNVIELTTQRTIKYPAGNVALAPGTLAAHLDASWTYKPDAGQQASGVDVALLKAKLPGDAFALVPAARDLSRTKEPSRRQAARFKESVMQ
jgi:hypothetical protein